jgi:hypothetical protein
MAYYHVPYHIAHPPIAPAPCEFCARAPRCKAELLACSAFALYYGGKATPKAVAIAPRVDAT